MIDKKQDKKAYAHAEKAYMQYSEIFQQKSTNCLHIILYFQDCRKVPTRNIFDGWIMHQLNEIFLHFTGKEILIRKYQ